MTIRSTALVVSAAMIAATATAGLAQGGAKFSATLTGAAEVPGPGDADGTGTASITINPGKSELCYELKVSGIDPATAAHIHTGSATQAGPVSIGLSAPTNGASSGCVTIARDLADAIRKAPQAYYVNVHNAAFPGGAVRGQLGK